MKLLLLGLDGLDFELTARWLDRLPTFRRLASGGSFQPLPSVYPPDSVPAWISFYLGVEPSDHGVLQSLDYVNADRQSTPDPAAFRGRTLWDEAGRQGRRVAVLNPFMAYPVWPVAGAMVSGAVFATGEPQSYPPQLLRELPAAHLGGFVEFPSTRQLPGFAQQTHAIARQQFAQATALFGAVDWDLAFATFLTPDRLQHFFWRFHDEEDPTYPGPSRLDSVLFDHYRLLDRELGKLVEKLPADIAVVVVSDHGHGRRPTRLFCLNEWLRRLGLLATPGGASLFSTPRLLEFTKRNVLQAARRFALEDLAFAAAQLLPAARRQALHKSEYSERGDRSLARRDSFGGNSPFGGIRLDAPAIRAAGLSPAAVCDELLAALRLVRDPSTGERIADWVRPREHVVSGTHAEAFPELLYQLKPHWGTDPSLFGGPFADEPMHRRLSGGHRPNGVLLTSLPHAPRVRLSQLRPWLLDVLATA